MDLLFCAGAYGFALLSSLLLAGLAGGRLRAFGRLGLYCLLPAIIFRVYRVSRRTPERSTDTIHAIFED